MSIRAYRVLTVASAPSFDTWADAILMKALHQEGLLDDGIVYVTSRDIRPLKLAMKAMVKAGKYGIRTIRNSYAGLGRVEEDVRRRGRALYLLE